MERARSPFPAISMGIYGYPHAEAARIAIKTARAHLQVAEHVELIRFVLRPATIDAFAAALADEAIEGEQSV